MLGNGCSPHVRLPQEQTDYSTWSTLSIKNPVPDIFTNKRNISCTYYKNILMYFGCYCVVMTSSYMCWVPELFLVFDTAVRHSSLPKDIFRRPLFFNFPLNVFFFFCQQLSHCQNIQHTMCLRGGGSREGGEGWMWAFGCSSITECCHVFFFKAFTPQLSKMGSLSFFVLVRCDGGRKHLYNHWF